MMGDGDRVEIDGGIMEGGGQILRVSTALSCLLGTPLRVRNIRAGRSQPGLRPQHLSGLEMVRDLCDGKMEGGEIGSTEITFTPGKIKGGTHAADTKTAGSVCLLMQVAMPCVLFAAAPSELHLKGGTNAEMAPQIDYTVMVFKPIVEKFNLTLDCIIKRRGYYPKGGGEVTIRMSPVKQLSPITLTDRGTVTKIHGRAFVAGALPIKIAKDMASAAVRCIRKEIRDLYVNIQTVREPDNEAFGTGTGIIIVAETSTGCLLAGSSLGKRGKSADRVGTEAAEMLLGNLQHGGAVDDYLQDQLIIFMALADGISRVKTGPITLHTETAIHFAEQLTKAKFTVTKSEDDGSSKDAYIIECQGIGLLNPNL
ncbi:RNA 3'-terminal phosphate cyclase isoform X1 [Sceloporus undulatus]|uniref:RNA 3'-terminal phosphate cyclase isoform X1 n=2 Tax=Sceloporus undulatus TaxID=8520 RepID=UPI001C4C4126|nr:RNA 3'-terminal phosphate cyclase isoform X1 [Sceloporus undulatus]